MIRTLLTLAVLAVLALCVLAMWLGWRGRARRQAAVLPPLPEPPVEPIENASELLAPTSGVYVGTTTAGDWQDRIAVGDLGYRYVATLRLTDAGLLMDRVGARPLWIPSADLRGARTDRALAGKVMTRDGLLVVTWQLGEHLLDTGFRADNKTEYAAWVAALAPAPVSGGEA
jgi:hypothetical protein